MTTHSLIKSGVIAAALVIGASVLRPTSLEATGHLMSSGLNGEVICIPGGPSDCTPTALPSSDDTL
jgi:hypothetical protein